MYLNKVQLIGNLTRDPELKSLPSGTEICSFSVATNRTWKDKNTGQKKEEVEFHNCIAFGKTAITIAEYMTKGQQIFVEEGRMKTSNWEKDGVKHYRTEVIVDRFQFGNKPVGSSTTSAPKNEAAQAPARNEGIDEPQQGGIDYPENEIDPNDIPF